MHAAIDVSGGTLYRDDERTAYNGRRRKSGRRRFPTPDAGAAVC